MAFHITTASVRPMRMKAGTAVTVRATQTRHIDTHYVNARHQDPHDVILLHLFEETNTRYDYNYYN